MTMAPRSVQSSRARRGDGCTSSDIGGDYSEAICENRGMSAEKKVVIIAGPNGAGKTMFAREFLPHEAGCPHFINADLIAAGLSPFDPDAAAFRAGRLMLEEIDRNAAAGISFAFETTLSEHTYIRRIRSWRSAGYVVKLLFLSLRSSDEA